MFHSAFNKLVSCRVIFYEISHVSSEKGRKLQGTDGRPFQRRRKRRTANMCFQFPVADQIECGKFALLAKVDVGVDNHPATIGCGDYNFKSDF